MDELRLSLLAIGIVVLIAVYALTMRTVRRRDRRHFRLGGDAGSMDSGRILNDYVNDLPAAAPQPRPRSAHDEVSAEDLDALEGMHAADDEPAELDVLYVDYDAGDDDDRGDAADTRSAAQAAPREPLTTPAPAAEVAPSPAGQAPPEQAAPAVAEAAPEPVAAAENEPDAEQSVPEMLIIFFLMGRDGQLDGSSIEQAASLVGMERSLRGTYDLYLQDGERRQQVLGLANALEPGVFDFAAVQDFVTPGLVLYMQLPGPLPALEAFEKMIDVGNTLAGQLDAILLDDSRNELSMQTIGQLRERIHDHELRMQFMARSLGSGLSPTL